MKYEEARENLLRVLGTKQYSRYVILRNRCKSDGTRSDGSTTKPETIALHVSDMKSFIDANPTARKAHNDYARASNATSKSRGQLPIFEETDQNAASNGASSADDHHENNTVDAGGDTDVEMTEAGEVPLTYNPPPNSTFYPLFRQSDGQQVTTTGIFDVTNPELFDLGRIHNLAQNFPDASISSMRVHVDNGHIVYIVVEMLHAPMADFIVTDYRIFWCMGPVPNWRTTRG